MDFVSVMLFIALLTHFWVLGSIDKHVERTAKALEELSELIRQAEKDHRPKKMLDGPMYGSPT